MHAVTQSLQQVYGEGRTASSSVEALRGSTNVQGQKTKSRVILNSGLWFHSRALSGRSFIHSFNKHSWPSQLGAGAVPEGKAGRHLPSWILQSSTGQPFNQKLCKYLYACN